MTLINIHFTIQDLTPRYPFLQHGTNLIPVRNQIAAVVLSSLTTLKQMLAAIGPRRARRYLSKRPGLVPAIAADVISGTASAWPQRRPQRRPHLLGPHPHRRTQFKLPSSPSSDTATTITTIT